MKKVLASALAASLVVGSIALAQPMQFTLDDSGFSYAARDDAPAYVGLVRDGNALRLTFSSTSDGATLPIVNVENVPELAGEDSFGNDRLATFENLAEIQLIRHGAIARGFAVVHENVDFGAAVDAYLQAIEALGFTAVADEGTSAVKVYTFQDGDATLRAMFRRTGADLRVDLQTL